MIRNGMSKMNRFRKLMDIAKYQREALDKHDFMKSIKKISDDVYLDKKNNELSE